MLPEPDHSPAGLAERRVGGSVPLDVPAQLRLPVPGVRRGLVAVLRTAVPEAAVHEDSDLARGEDDVWADPDPGGQVEPVVLAVPVTLAVQRPPQRHLRSSVGAPIGPHIGGAPRTGRLRVVRHSGSGYCDLAGPAGVSETGAAVAGAVAAGPVSSSSASSCRVRAGSR